MNVDPKHIIQLHMIVELGSYSRAAEKLNITQPGLTRNIRVLEERLGVKLLRRGKTGARPTDEGKVIAAYGKKLFEINQRVSGYFDGLRVGDFGKIRLGLAYTLSNAYLANPIHEYLEEKTHSVIQVSSGSTQELVEQLQAEGSGSLGGIFVTGQHGIDGTQKTLGQQGLTLGQGHLAGWGATLPKDKIILANLSGRGDKDMHTVAERMGLNFS